MRTERRRGTDAAVEAVEGGVEVEAWAKAVHLQEHLGREQRQEQELCIVWRNGENATQAEGTRSGVLAAVALFEITQTPEAVL